MRILLDTHIVIWAMTGSAKLTQYARNVLTDLDNDIFLSAASLWEVALKHNRRPDKIPVSAEQVARYCNGNGIWQLPVRFQHVLNVNALPPIHADPFDRMIVTQALSESLTLLTHDDLVAQYGDSIIKV